MLRLSTQNLAMENFEKLQLVNYGRFGEVYRARNLLTGAFVTVREFNRQGERFGLREVEVFKALPVLNSHLISVLGHFWRNNGKILCVVYQDQSNMITLRNYLDLVRRNQAPNQALIEDDNPTLMLPDAIKLMMYWFLVAVDTCHKHRVIHRGLSPANVLLSFRPLRVRLCDFRSARHEPVLGSLIMDGYGFGDDDKEGDGHFTPPKDIFGSSLQYSAPELLMGAKTYTAAVDVWSIGMIFAEMINGAPLVQNSRTADGQLRAIFGVLGRPTIAEKNLIPGLGDFQWNNFNGIPMIPPTPLAGLVPRLDPAGVALLTRMLDWVPARRITVNQALSDAYFNDTQFDHF